MSAKNTTSQGVIGKQRQSYYYQYYLTNPLLPHNAILAWYTLSKCVCPVCHMPVLYQNG